MIIKGYKWVDDPENPENGSTQVEFCDTDNKKIFVLVSVFDETWVITVSSSDEIVMDEEDIIESYEGYFYQLIPWLKGSAYGMEVCAAIKIHQDNPSFSETSDEEKHSQDYLKSFIGMDSSAF